MKKASSVESSVGSQAGQAASTSATLPFQVNKPFALRVLVAAMAALVLALCS